MAASNADTLHSAASYQKLPGTIALSNATLSWTPSSSASSSASQGQVSIPLTSVSGLSMSKAGAATVALQVAFDEEGVKATNIQKAKCLFTFTGGIGGSQAQAEGERETFKERLVGIIADNRARREQGGDVQPAATTSRNASGPSTPRDGTPGAAATPPRGQANRAAATSAPTELSLRISLLKADPSLAALHRQTVMAGLIPDSEFWSHPTRQGLLRSARQSASQQKGRNARIVDPRFTVGKNGELKMEITDEDRRDLLEQNDVLRLAWSENVPEKLDESAFWQRYFTSSLYHVLRTSSRSSSFLNSRAGQGGNQSSSPSAAIKPDDIFDSYLPLVQSRYVDTNEPGEGFPGRNEARNRLVDLGATESDHAETGNEKDWTMRGGAQKGALPLVRRFNEHSERVLSTSLGQTETEHVQSAEGQKAEQINRRPAKKARTEGERGVELEDHIHSAHAQRYEEEIVIEDLEERRERIAVPLNLSIDETGSRSGERGPQRARPARAPQGKADATHASTTSTKPLSSAETLSAMGNSLSQMPGNGVIELDFLVAADKRKQTSANGGSLMALETELRELLLARRNKGQFDLHELPDALRKKALDVHGSATEVMRQFWNAISPPDKEDESNVKVEETGEAPPPAPTPEEREAKAKRMMQILAQVQNRFEEVLKQVENLAGANGGELEHKLESAFTTSLDACKRASVVGDVVYGQH